MTPTIIFDHVSKKFSKSYISDSLRDTLIKPFAAFLSKNGNSQEKTAKHFWALRNVAFEVEPGETLGIIGPNGSGKTTTLKLLSRIYRPDEGKIVVTGRIGALIELGAGFNPDLNGRENVYLNASILGMSRDDIQTKYDEIVKFAELQDFMETPVKWYSTGMFARLGFSVAVHTNPDILLVDEILSVGDVGFQRKCLDKMKSFSTRGTTIVFVSHNMQSVATLCDRTMLLEKGIIKKKGPTEEIISYYMGQYRKKRMQAYGQASLEMGIVYDDTGLECATFECGQRARVKVAIRFNESFDNIDITIGIISSNGQLISWVNANALGREHLSVNKNEVVNLSVDLSLNITSGAYEFNVTILNRVEGKTIWEQVFSPFFVKENPTSTGTAFLNPELVNQTVTPSRG